MRTIIAAFALLAAGAAQASEPHQHGVAQVTVAVEGNAIAIEFISPMENLVGFEHAPRTAKQRKAIEAMKRAFATPGKLFVPSAEAGCTAEPVQLELPDHQHKHTHSDLHATISFQCVAPDALGSMDVRLFDVFPRLSRVKAGLAVPGRQLVAELNRRQTQLKW